MHVVRAIGSFEGNPEFRGVRWKGEVGWQNADDGVRIGVQINGFAEDLGIAAEAAFPKSVAE